MKKLMLVFMLVFVAAAAHLASGCASRFVRESASLEAPDSSEIGNLTVPEGDKGVTPRTLFVERVLNSDGSLNHVRIIADVMKGTMLCLFTPEDSPQEGRRRVLIERGGHGVFLVPARYIVDFDLVHGNFIKPNSWIFGSDSWAELTRNPAPGHHGVACVVNHEGEGTCLCFIDALPVGAQRARHQKHALGAPDMPGGKEHRLPIGTAESPPASGGATTYIP